MKKSEEKKYNGILERIQLFKRPQDQLSKQIVLP